MVSGTGRSDMGLLGSAKDKAEGVDGDLLYTVGSTLTPHRSREVSPRRSAESHMAEQRGRRITRRYVPWNWPAGCSRAPLTTVRRLWRIEYAPKLS